MIYPRNQNWQTSRLPFSLALANDVSTGVSFNTPGGFIGTQQRWARAGFQGFGPRKQYSGAGMDGLGHGCGCGGGCGCGSHGMGGLTFDGTGLFGTGIFGGDPSTWGIAEIVAGALGIWVVRAVVLQFGQEKVRAQGLAQRRRKSRAARLRAKAKALEDAPFGGLGGILGFGGA